MAKSGQIIAIFWALINTFNSDLFIDGDKRFKAA